VSAQRLDGKRALVTGGARGIGRATAQAFVAAGARAVLLDRDADEAQRVAADLGNAEAHALDVTNETAVDGLIDTLAARIGRIDILVNSAGASIRKPTAELSKAEWDTVIAVNQTAIFLCSRAAARHMLKKKSGAIVNLASIMGVSGGGLYPNVSYQASKGAVVNMTRALAIDHGPQGIRVNSVNPGDVNTGMLRDEARQLSQDADAFLAEAADRPLQRMGEPREIAAAVVWLASDESSYVTGSALVVDGGGIA